MKSYFLTSQKKLQYKLLLGDLVLIAGSIFTAYAIRIYMDNGNVSFQMISSRIHVLSIAFFILHPLVLYVMGLYTFVQEGKDLTRFLTLFGAVVFAGIIAASMLFFAPKILIGRKILLIHLPLLTVFLYMWRAWIFNKFHTTNIQIGLALIGREDILSSFIEEIGKNQYSEYDVKCYYVTERSKKNKACFDNRSLSVECSIKALLDNNDIQAIAIDSGLVLSNDELNQIFDFRFKDEKVVYDLTQIYQSLTGKIPLSYIDDRWFVNNPAFQGYSNEKYLKIKRLIDISSAILLALLSCPLIILISIYIKLDSRGPIFFVQERLGKNRKPFNCYKFRTMVRDSEKKSGPVWAETKDPRITRAGKVLRKTRLDELPQLLNILIGNLSFAGPRPIRKHFADLLEKKIPYYDLRFSVIPGLSGWAQVNYDYAGSEEGQLEKLQYELFYIQHMSIILDMHIFIKTIKTMLSYSGK